MPLAGHVGAIACRLEGFRNGDAVAIQISAVTIKAVIAHHVTDSCLVRVEPCEQRGAGGAATAGVVKLGEANPVLGESVEMGCLNFPAIASDVGPAHVIRHDEDDVGLFWGGVGCCRDQHGEAEERAYEFHGCEGRHVAGRGQARGSGVNQKIHGGQIRG